MKQLRKRIIFALLSLLMVLSFSMPAFASNAQETLTTSQKALNAINSAATFRLSTLENPSTGNNNEGDWFIFALQRGDVEIANKEEYTNKYISNVKSNISSLQYPSDYARVIITLTSLGVDCSKEFEGVNLIEKMLADKASFEGTFASNAIYALIALNCNDYDIPSTCDITQEDLVSALLSYKDEKTNLFYFSTDKTYGTDLDTTFMANQALSLCNVSDDNLKTQIQNAKTACIETIKSSQSASGAISSYGMDNACTTAQAIVVLTQIGEDVNSYQKDGKTLVDGLLSMQDSNTNGFIGYTGKADIQTTDQSLYALVAYSRSEQGLNTLFDMNSTDTLSFDPDSFSAKVDKFFDNIKGFFQRLF